MKLYGFCIYCASAPSLHRESTNSLIYIDIYKKSAICLISVGLTQLVLFLHSMLIIRECVGAVVGGAMVYGVGFRTMAAVRFIHGSGVYITLVYLHSA